MHTPFICFAIPLQNKAWRDTLLIVGACILFRGLILHPFSLVAGRDACVCFAGFSSSSSVAVLPT